MCVFCQHFYAIFSQLLGLLCWNSLQYTSWQPLSINVMPPLTKHTLAIVLSCVCIKYREKVPDVLKKKWKEGYHIWKLRRKFSTSDTLTQKPVDIHETTKLNQSYIIYTQACMCVKQNNHFIRTWEQIHLITTFTTQK